ncbi:MAG: hypothetical protein UY94_C0013G0009 [Parcubacteria group bacterium GW2011_GWA2_56_21]|nr:MAG: hypothetical protein UY94_C0013G0009 [Parcubacteria group bacterium GW2011_GWA2_56_21]
MVEVPVRDDRGAHALFVLLEIRGIRERVVGARRVVLFFEMEAHIKHEDVAVHIDRDHIAAYFFDAAEGNDAHDIFCRRFWIIVGSAACARGQ